MTRTEYIQQHAPSFVAAALHITQLREAHAFYAACKCDADKKKQDIVYLCAELAAMQADVFGLKDERPNPPAGVIQDHPNRAQRRNSP